MIHSAIKYYIFTFLLLCIGSAQAQVGIGNENPKGMLDLANNENLGIVFPSAALTSTIVEAPVTNPNGSSLVTGTIIFNTNTTSTGSNDVNPGIYAWDGSRWIPQYLREDSAIFEQSPLDQRVTLSGGYVDINGLGSGSTFTPKYTGTYRIKANFSFGAGKINLPSSGDIAMATQEGLFRFTWDGTAHDIYTHAYSIYNADVSSGAYYSKFRHDSSLVLYETLTAGQTYNFQLEIDVLVSNDFEDGGNANAGRPYVGITVPCTVEMTYLQEQ